jgi:hypothetical protein
MEINHISTQTKYLKLITFILGFLGTLTILFLINFSMRKFIEWSLNYSTFDPNDSYTTLNGILFVSFVIMTILLKVYIKEDKLTTNE